MHTQHQYDVLIIGSGAAGLTLALRLPKRARIAVLSKGPVQEGNTWYAQGGISAVLDHKDSLESHITDTMSAGAGLCDPDAVRFTVEQGPEAVKWLVDLGVPFTRREERKHEDEVKENGYHRIERRYGTFQRAFEIPGGFDPDKIQARFEDGVLHVNLPKREEAKPRHIEVKVN